MDNIPENEEGRLFFDGDVVEVPITLKFLVERDRLISKAYAYMHTIEDPEMHEVIEKVCAMACDSHCNLCYNRRVDPTILDLWDEEYDMIVTTYKPFCFYGDDDEE